MIIHPDGRLEGTPDELAAYMNKQASTPPYYWQQYYPWWQKVTTPAGTIPGGATNIGKIQADAQKAYTSATTPKITFERSNTQS